MGYDIEAIRAQVRAKLKKGKDPTEFRAPKVDDGKTVKFRFYVLPPLAVGDAVNDGKATCERAMELFAIPNGAHYIDNKRIGCPRIINEEDCDICTYGFDLLAEIDGSTVEGKKRRGEIGKALLPGQYHLVNLYFPPIETNPEELRGKVLWFNAPKTVVDIWLECLYRDDDGGDAEEPLPFGVFYDECKAYLFQLDVTKDGQMNSYKRSKFLVTQALGARPIAVDKERKADVKRIKEILAKRHNLWEKMPAVDHEEVAKVAAALSGRAAAKNAGTSSGGFDHDEDATATEGAAPEAAPAKPAATTAKAAVKPAATKAATAKPAATKQAAATKAAAAKPAVKKEEPAPALEEEPVEELETEPDAELAGEAPVEEASGEAVEAEGDVDGEVDRLLDELNS